LKLSNLYYHFKRRTPLTNSNAKYKTTPTQNKTHSINQVHPQPDSFVFPEG